MTCYAKTLEEKVTEWSLDSTCERRKADLESDIYGIAHGVVFLGHPHKDEGEQFSKITRLMCRFLYEIKFDLTRVGEFQFDVNGNRL